MEADVGIEPTWPALQAGALPFCYSADDVVSFRRMAENMGWIKLSA